MSPTKETARQILVTAGSVTVEAELNPSATAQAVWETLPITGQVNTWGDEVYFYVSLKMPEENPQAVVEAGDFGYWPVGPALCLFFGPTPASRGNEIRPASPVNIIGRVKGDARVLKGVADGESIKLTRRE
ncbi:MAG: cyclophilin-like fold protein [Bacillota bacterium]